jgi:uncharacterized protein (TIGR03382 family)
MSKRVGGFGCALGLAATLFASAPVLAEAPDQLSPYEPQISPVPTTFRAIPEAMANQTHAIFAPGGAPLPVFLNRHGGTYIAGWDNSATNTSSIVDSGSATVGAFIGSDAQWAEVLGCVQQQFAAFNVVVTDAEPSAGSYIEAVVGGSPDQIGLPWGVGGVAPIDPYNCNLLDKAVVYAFADVYLGNGWGGTQALCETVTQEVAHAMSLDHVLICEDPMTYLNGCGDKWFQDEWGTCGEYEPRDCTCNRPSQNSVQILLEKLGPSDGSPPPPPVEDNQAPSISMVTPDDGATFQAETEVAITATITDDVGLTQVRLYWENNDIWLACPGQGGGWACSQAGSNYTWTLSPAAGSRTFFIEARDVGGNTSQSDEITIWLTEDGAAPPEDTMPPDVALIAPAAGAELQAQGNIQVVVSASDDAGIAGVELEWDYSGDSFPCPLNSQFVDCEVSGTTYTWTLYVGDGERTFRARATDIVGNVVVTEDRTISLVDEPAAPPANDGYEENDTWDQSTPISCGDTLELVALGGDDDWFQLTVPADRGLQVELGGPLAGELGVSVRSGPFSGSVLADGSGAAVVELVPEVDLVGVLVTADGGTYGDYTLTVACPDASDMFPLDPPDDETPGDGDGDPDPADDNGDKDPPTDGTPGDAPGDETPGGEVTGGAGGCSSTSTVPAGSAATGTFALLLLGGLLRRRRR